MDPSRMRPLLLLLLLVVTVSFSQANQSSEKETIRKDNPKNNFIRRLRRSFWGDSYADPCPYTCSRDSDCFRCGHYYCTASWGGIHSYNSILAVAGRCVPMSQGHNPY